MVKAPVHPSVKRSYRALADSWIAGRRVQAGELLELTADEAKYEAVEAAQPVTGKRRAEVQGS